MTSLAMEAKDLVQKGNTLKVTLAVTNSADTCYSTTVLSPEYVIGRCAVFQVRVKAARIIINRSYRLYSSVFIRFVKRRPESDSTYTIRFTSSIFGITNKCFTSDDGTWHLVHENEDLYQYNIDLAIQMDIVPSASTFSPLHEDMELTDFELRGVDGSLRFHKVVLAASSPVLGKMLTGTWRETTEGHIDVAGTSKMTLQHLKNYMYLRTLPDEDLQQLVILASYYMMPELEERCVIRLVNSLTVENACDLLEFAVSNKLTRLLLAILECVQNRAVDVNEVHDYFLRGEGQISADTKHGNDEKGGDKQEERCD